MRLRIAPVECRVCPDCKTCPHCGHAFYQGVKCPHCRRRWDSFSARTQSHNRLIYEGSQCPECGWAFVPAHDETEMKTRLIVVSGAKPPYDRVRRCCCPECGNYYVLTIKEIEMQARCEHCHSPLIDGREEKQLTRELREQFTAEHRDWVEASFGNQLLKLARRIDQRRGGMWQSRRRSGQQGQGSRIVAPSPQPCLSCQQPLARVCWCPRCRAAGNVGAGCAGIKSCLPSKDTTVLWVRNFDDFPETPEEIRTREDLDPAGEQGWAQQLMDGIPEGYSFVDKNEYSMDED